MMRFGMGEYYEPFSRLCLVLEQQPSQDSHKLAKLLNSWRSPFIISSSPAQVLDNIRDISPCLVILVGNHRAWPHQFSRKLRLEANLLGYTILALTDAASPNWPQHEDISIFDGFLVQPLSSDILASILKTAQAKRSVKESNT